MWQHPELPRRRSTGLSRRTPAWVLCLAAISGLSASAVAGEQTLDPTSSETVKPPPALTSKSQPANAPTAPAGPRVGTHTGGSQSPVEAAPAPVTTTSGAPEGQLSTIRGGSWNLTPPPKSDPATAPVGTGFTGPTTEPSVVGDAAAPGATAKAIARWDMIPFQMLQGQAPIGVVAFHINEIDRVEFSVNGGAWTAARQMTLNPATNVWEYWLSVDTSRLSDGPFEVRAIAFPRVGQPRLLEPLTLVANNGGTLSTQKRYVSPQGDDTNGDGTSAKPFKTIWKAADSIQRANGGRGADNGTIYLKTGEYVYAERPQGGVSIKTPSGWLTLAGAPGTTPQQVRIVGNSGNTGGLNVTRLKVQNLSVLNTGIPGSGGLNCSIWFDGCTLVGAGNGVSTNFAAPTAWKGGIYATKTQVRDVLNGFIGAQLLRDVDLKNLGSEGIRNPVMAVNCTVRGIQKPAGTGYHPDLMQFHGNFDNVIVYGLRASDIWAQGIFSRGTDGLPDKNIAFVNVQIEAKNYLSQWLQSADHVLFWNVNLLGRAMNISNDHGPTVLTNFSFRDSIFQEMRCDPNIISKTDARAFSNNHFIAGSMYGASATTGALQFKVLADGFSAPVRGSAADRRVTTALAPTDAAGKKREAASAIGALAAE